MGVYSLEAAERLAAKNKDTELLDESYIPYENPILEYAITSIRADFAMFEAMLEMDFADYYQSLTEAPATPAQNNQDPAPATDDVDLQRKQKEFDKENEEEAKKKALDEKNAKDARMSAALNKMKNTSGMLRKIGETIKKIWEAFKRGVANLFNRFFQGYDSFLQDRGAKFDTYVSNIDKNDISKFDGEVKVYDIDSLTSAYDKIVNEWKAIANDESPVQVKAKLEDLEKAIESAKNSAKNAKGSEAVQLIKSIKAKNIKTIASSKKDEITKAADEMERKMSIETAQAKIDKGDEADSDTALQQKREVTQLLVNFGNKLANDYAGSLANANASAYAGAAKINGFFVGKGMVSVATSGVANAAKQKAQPAVDAVKNKADEIKTKAEINKAIRDGVNNMESQNASADISDNDDVFTEAELCSTLGAILEDNAMIEFDECFEF